MLEEAYQSIRAQLAADLLERVKSGSPRFFESLVVELLLKMGLRAKPCGCRSRHRGLW